MVLITVQRQCKYYESKKVPWKKVSGKVPGNKNFSQVLGKNVTGNKVPGTFSLK